MYTLVLSLLLLFPQGNVLYESHVPGFKTLQDCEEASNKASLAPESIKTFIAAGAKPLSADASCVPEGKPV